jgi:hypothetical protein
MNFSIEPGAKKTTTVGQAEVLALRGLLVYGQTCQEAIAGGKLSPCRVLVNQLENGESNARV